MIGNVNSSVQIRKTKQNNFVYFNGEMFEELALHSSVLLFPICSLSSCMGTDFSLCPSCGQRAEVDEWNKKAELEHQIPDSGSGCWVCVGSWQEAAWHQLEQRQPRRRGGSRMLCMLPALWCGFMEEECHRDETGSEQRCTWLEPVKPVACEALRLWRCSWSPHSHHFLFQPMWSAAVCSSALSQVPLFGLMWTLLLFSFPLFLSLFPYFTFIWFDLLIMPFLTLSWLFHFPNHFLAKPLPAVGKEHTQLIQYLLTVIFPLLLSCISKSLPLLSAPVSRTDCCMLDI